jgi:hypothetical protein
MNLQNQDWEEDWPSGRKRGSSRRNGCGTDRRGLPRAPCTPSPLYRAGFPPLLFCPLLALLFILPFSSAALVIWTGPEKRGRRASASKVYGWGNSPCDTLEIPSAKEGCDLVVTGDGVCVFPCVYPSLADEDDVGAVGEACVLQDRNAGTHAYPSKWG